MEVFYDRLATRPNPQILGEDPMRALQVGAGIAGSSYMANKVGMPFLRSFWKGLASANNVMAQAANIAATLTFGWLGSEGLRAAGFHRAANNWRFGAVVASIAKGAAIPLKDWYPDSGLPEIPGLTTVGRQLGAIGGGYAALGPGSAAPTAVGPGVGAGVAVSSPGTRAIGLRPTGL